MIDDLVRLKRKKDLARDSRAGFDTSVEEDARLRQSNPGLKQRQLSAFFGDVGTIFSGPAREEIEKDNAPGDEGLGDPGNNVDFSQRHSQSEADLKEQEEFAGLPEWAALHPGKYGLRDLAKRERFWQYQCKRDAGELAPRKPAEPEENSFNMASKAASDKFWGDEDELQRVAKRVRPPRL